MSKNNKLKKTNSIGSAQNEGPVKVFVSGCYDILHGGHIQFFREAKALGLKVSNESGRSGAHLTVSFASDPVLKKYKGRKSAMPMAHKRRLIEEMRSVDEVVSSSNPNEPLLDFKNHFMKIRPDLLVVTADDKNVAIKQVLCDKIGAQLIVLPKTPPGRITPISTTQIRERILKN